MKAMTGWLNLAQKNNIKMTSGAGWEKTAYSYSHYKMFRLYFNTEPFKVVQLMYFIAHDNFRYKKAW